MLIKRVSVFVKSENSHCVKKEHQYKTKPDLLLLIKAVHTTVLPNIFRLYARQTHTGHLQLKCTDVEQLTKGV